MFEAAAHRFVDISDPGFGLALLNNAKYGHSVRGNVIGISLVRSPIYPDPLADEGERSFTYALMPHAGAWHKGGVLDEANDLNQPLLAKAARGLAAGVVTPLVVEGTPVARRAADQAAGRVGAVRAAEHLGRAAPAERAEEIMPFEVRTWRLSRA